MIAFISFLFLLAGILAVAFGHLHIRHTRTKARGKELVIVGLTLCLLAVGGMLAGMLRFDTLSSNQPHSISTFAECVAAGYPVQESYPEACRANGQTFVNEVSKKQSCPGQWYVTTTPAGTDIISQEYFVYDGQRVERAQVDVDWVVANCQTKQPTPAP